MKPVLISGAGSTSPVGGARKPIKGFSTTSYKRFKFRLRNTPCTWRALLTLTYPHEFPRDGSVSKEHLNRLLTQLRRDYPGIKYLWWVEYQERGAVHFHVFTSCVVPGETYLNKLWHHIVGSNCKAHARYGAHVQILSGDAAELARALERALYYARKARQKHNLRGMSYKVGRAWGCSRGLMPRILELPGLSVPQLQTLRPSSLAPLLEGKPIHRAGWLGGYCVGDNLDLAEICREYYSKSFFSYLLSFLEEPQTALFVRESVAHSLSSPCLLTDLRSWQGRVCASAEERCPVEGQPFKASAVSYSDWLLFLDYVLAREKSAWAARARPLYEPEYDIHIDLHSEGFSKRRYASVSESDRCPR